MSSRGRPLSYWCHPKLCRNTKRHCEFTHDEKPFVQEMQGYWKSFFYTGAPTAESSNWPVVRSANRSEEGSDSTGGGDSGKGGDRGGDGFTVRYIDILGSKPVVMTERNADCAFWAALEPVQ